MPKPLHPENVKYLVLHCSGTRCNQAFTVAGLINTGNQRFGQPSYHYYVQRDGTIVPILPESVQGIHAVGYNHCSIAICYEGGLNEHGVAADTRTELQKHALFELRSDGYINWYNGAWNGVWRGGYWQREPVPFSVRSMPTPFMSAFV